MRSRGPCSEEIRLTPKEFDLLSLNGVGRLGQEGLVGSTESPKGVLNSVPLDYSEIAVLTLFGLGAVTAMLVCYAFEHRGAGWILGFAFACALGSVYGFLQGAWPFGLVEAVWSVVAVRRWWLARAQLAVPSHPRS